MKILYMGTAAAEGWPGLFCSCDVCSHARKAGGRNLRTRTQAMLDDDLLLDFPPDDLDQRFPVFFQIIHDTAALSQVINFFSHRLTPSPSNLSSI